MGEFDINLPEGYTVLEYAATLKVLDQNGKIQLVEKRTAGLSAWEAIGMLQTYCDTLRAGLLNISATPE